MTKPTRPTSKGDPDQAGANTAPSPADRVITPDTSLRVLIVEDEPRLRDVLSDELPRLGFEATGAGSAEQATRLLAEGSFDVVTLDLNLPVTDGMTFLESFRREHPDTPVIILTGFGDLDAAKKAIDHEVTAFLTKPCQLGDLERALSKARQRLMEKQREAALLGDGADGWGDENSGMNLPEGLEAEARQAAADEASKDTGDAGENAAEPTDLASIERRAILAALHRHHGNRTAAAAELGISRRTLYNRLAEYAQGD